MKNNAKEHLNLQEAWTTLLRTVHSVIDRTPPQLLTEIVLVDDFSPLRFGKCSFARLFQRL